MELAGDSATTRFVTQANAPFLDAYGRQPALSVLSLHFK
jgi:hypothetical protein